MEPNYIKYYDLENYILNDVRSSFMKVGYLNAFDFFCIVIWKSNRAKSNIARRLLKYNSNLDSCIKDLSNKIFLADTDKEKLKVLISDFGFRLPMSSAILTILYPENFTIYDIRVCEAFPDFKGIDDLTFEKLWIKYCEYIETIKNYGSKNISLRDKDRTLWAKSFYEQLKRDITSDFKRQDNSI